MPDDNRHLRLGADERILSLAFATEEERVAARDRLLSSIDAELGRLGLAPEERWKWEIRVLPDGQSILMYTEAYQRQIHRPMPQARLLAPWWVRWWSRWVGWWNAPSSRCILLPAGEEAALCPNCGVATDHLYCAVCRPQFMPDSDDDPPKSFFDPGV